MKKFFWVILLVGCTGSEVPSPSMERTVEGQKQRVGVQVKIDRVAIEKPVLIGLGGAEELGEDCLVVEYTIENVTDDRKIDFRSWGATVDLIGLTYAEDLQGNRYRRIPKGVYQDYKLDWSGSLYPKQSKQGTVCFESPIKFPCQLKIVLSGLAMQSDDEIELVFTP